MTDGKPAKAPIIIFGSMLTMSIITVAIVFVTHSVREEPYLQARPRRVSVFHTPRNALALNYEAFGPQTMAQELVGFQRWQWSTADQITAGERFDIKVVVYRDASEDELTERFPVSKIKFQDYRYLEYDKAMRYLETHIAKAGTLELTARLRDTRLRLTQFFGK